MNEKTPFLPPGRLLSTAAVAARLNVSPRTVARLVHRGVLRGVRVGRVIRIRPDDLEDFLEGDHQ